jgi:hypothetical protein
VKTSALDCLARGLYSVRANWELVPLVILQQLAVLVLTVASLVALVVPFAGTFGLAGLAGLAELDLLELEGWVAGALADWRALVVPLVAGLVASLLVGMLAFVVLCWFQAGIVAVLLAGDRQALPGPARDWRLFRTFEWPAFSAWAGRWMWRFFWFFNLYLVVLLLLTLVWVLLIVLAVWGGERWGQEAAFGIGCGSALPMIFVLIVTVAWFWLAQADLPREGSGVRRASRRALEVLARRWPALLLLFLLYFGAAMALGFSVAPLGFRLPQPMSDGFAAYCVGQLVLTAVQTVLSSVVNLAFLAAVVALMNSEASAPLPRSPATVTAEGTA